MKYLNLIFLFLQALIVMSCAAHPDYCDLAYGIINSYSKELKKKKS